MARPLKTMNLLLLFLAFLCVAAVGTGVYLYLLLRRKEADLAAAQLRHGQADDQGPAASEMTAIDQYLYERCCRYMTEHRPFLVESFTLQDLANAVYTNKAYLSKTINRFSGRNFRQYVNYYRVMYSLDLFRENMSLRVTEMASLSGFHSTTSFNQSFKAVMGGTPSYWCARIRKKHMEKMKT